MVTPKKPSSTRRSHSDVDALLRVLRSHGVHQYRDGEFAVVLMPVHGPATTAAGEDAEPKFSDDPVFDAVRG